MVDLLFITLFFCFRYCEYSKTNYHLRTTQFFFQCIQFHDDNGAIPPDTAADVFLSALAITLHLDTQKNCVRGEPYTIEATGLLHGDPVPACARCYLHLRKHNALLTLLSVLIMFRWAPPQICDWDKYRGAPTGHRKTDWLPAARLFTVRDCFPLLTFGRCHDPSSGPYLRWR